MNQLKHIAAAFLCLYYLMLSAWANHQDKVHLLP